MFQNHVIFFYWWYLLVLYFYPTGVRLKFITPLQDQTVKEGETAYFQFELSHEGMLVKWYKNDKRLHTSRTVFITSEGKVHKLEMREVTLDDISEIKAVVKDMNTQANLKVLGNCLNMLYKMHYIVTTKNVFKE